MSLLHDAMKEKQREKAARAQPGADDQIVVEGFFPYVSSSAARPRSRRAPVIVATVAAAVFLTVVVWAVWPKNAKHQTPARAPIILPPPVTVVQKPVVTDSPTTAVVTRARRRSKRQRRSRPVRPTRRRGSRTILRDRGPVRKNFRRSPGPRYQRPNVSPPPSRLQRARRASTTSRRRRSSSTRETSPGRGTGSRSRPASLRRRGRGPISESPCSGSET